MTSAGLAAGPSATSAARHERPAPDVRVSRPDASSAASARRTATPPEAQPRRQLTFGRQSVPWPQPSPGQPFLQVLGPPDAPHAMALNQYEPIALPRHDMTRSINCSRGA